MRDTDYIAAKLLDLGTKKDHFATEYEGEIHLRYRRRVVLVYNPIEDTYRVNEVAKRTEIQAVNRALVIIGAKRKLHAWSPPRSPNSRQMTTDGKEIKAAITPIWNHRLPGQATGATSAFTPREAFSGPLSVSLSTAAGRAAHEEAINE